MLEFFEGFPFDAEGFSLEQVHGRNTRLLDLVPLSTFGFCKKVILAWMGLSGYRLGMLPLNLGLRFGRTS